MPSARNNPKRKTARQKLGRVHPSHGKAFPIPRGMAGFPGTMIVPRQLDVEAMMRAPRKGRVITLGRIRECLARAARADRCCPLTTGIFARLAAEAAEEDAAAGLRRITPYWRTIRDDGRLNERFPGGVRAQAAKLRSEGIPVGVSGRGRTLKVTDFESRLAQPTPRP